MRWKLAAPPLHSAALALHIHAPRNHVRALRCAAILLMTMALAVAMVACQGAVGTAGKDGKDAPGIEPQVVNGGIPDTEVDVGESKRMDVSGTSMTPMVTTP